MGIACSMSRILQQGCTVPVPDPTGGPGCFIAHPDPSHHMTWIVDEPPATWVMPISYDFGDATSSTSLDGEDAHEYDMSGTYVITGTDADGRTCSATVTVPT